MTQHPTSIQDWKRLPEFEISAIAEVNVLEVGSIAFPTQRIEAAAIGPTYVLTRVPGFSGPLGVLPSARIDVSGAPALYRLPLELGEWAYDICCLAEGGVRPLPARLQFQRLGSGFLVTPVPVSRAKPLAPNSSAWLEALGLLNAKSALQTLATIRKARNEIVCSLCGRTPSWALSSTDVTFPVGTIRLCQPCREQQTESGGNLVPLN